MIRLIMAILAMSILYDSTKADVVTLPDGEDLVPVDEALNEYEFADSYLTPSQLGAFGIGDTIVEGSILNASMSDEDAFTFHIAPGTQLESITLDYATGATRHFFGLDTGTSLTFPENYDGQSLLVAHLFSDSDSGADLLTINTPGDNYNSIAPPGSLGAGDYSVWIRETDLEDFDYSMTFRVSAVAIPEPSALAALVSGGVVVALRRRSRQS
ncbi:PEP-CTERM sorting domain-containing protein [Roseiconus lacunae]|uniref:PEP-CTERM sorting domain-containing protein n=1 Tax=Roseiconus lacunae TaxID=2605694 RepID=A0ABT7PEU9_9BACT|nr:PEP-CTERM sorting domain-containing protein [Roseiconus lacunae]MDM4015018.1 PEP-CTERM sorting domain-containing protein [Roseiconus lacunae]